MEINSFRKEEKIIMKKVNELLYNKYGDSINNYNKQNISYLIYSVNSKYLSAFRECILDSLDEYHKRFYNINECSIKLKQFFLYYLNYLTFFCRPVFHNFYYNNLLQYYNDIKADIFYQENYKNKENNGDKNEDEITSNIEKHISRDNLFDENNSITRNKFGKINLLIFDPETRNKIDNSSDMMSSIAKINDNDEPNVSYRQKLKISNNEYITLRNNENLLDFIKEISFKNSKSKKNNNEINCKNFNKTSLNSHSSSPIHKIIKRYISGDITINNKLK